MAARPLPKQIRNPDLLVPVGYGQSLVTIKRLWNIHSPNMHPTYAVLLFMWLEHKGGLVGIGGGFRSTGSQPDKPGFAPEGRSFHQFQNFVSGRRAYCAVDLVHVSGRGVHRSPTWAEVADLNRNGLHAFIKGEPWHAQTINIRGWGSWRSQGRPDPADHPSSGTVPPIEEHVLDQLDRAMRTTLRKGGDSAATTLLQTILTAIGYPCVIDGDFGSATKRAVKQFQSDHGLTVDGVVGPSQTWPKLNEVFQAHEQKEPQQPDDEKIDPVPPTAGRGTYIVRKGDSFWRISERVYGPGIYWNDIARSNGMDGNSTLIPGRELLVPNVRFTVATAGSGPIAWANAMGVDDYKKVVQLNFWQGTIHPGMVVWGGRK